MQSQFIAMIPDGYSDHGFIEARPPSHGDFRFKYRPALLEERAPIVDIAGNGKPLEFIAKATAFAWPRISSWSLPVPVSEEAFKSLRPGLRIRLTNIILGVDPGDVDPEWSYEDQKSYADLEQTAKVNGVSLATQSEINSAKN